MGSQVFTGNNKKDFESLCNVLLKQKQVFCPLEVAIKTIILFYFNYFKVLKQQDVISLELNKPKKDPRMALLYFKTIIKPIFIK